MHPIILKVTLTKKKKRIPNGLTIYTTITNFDPLQIPDSGQKTMWLSG